MFHFQETLRKSNNNISNINFFQEYTAVHVIIVSMSSFQTKIISLKSTNCHFRWTACTSIALGFPKSQNKMTMNVDLPKYIILWTRLVLTYLSSIELIYIFLVATENAALLHTFAKVGTYLPWYSIDLPTWCGNYI